MDRKKEKEKRRALRKGKGLIENIRQFSKKQEDKIDRMGFLMNEYYLERTLLILTITKLFPSWLEDDKGVDSAMFRTAVCCKTPAGVVYWHMRQGHILQFFKHLKKKDTKLDFDKITREDVYERIALIDFKKEEKKKK